MPNNEKPTNLADNLTGQALLRPDAPAIHLPAREVSFRQLENLVWRTAAFLHRNQIRSGDVVALTFENELMLIITVLATARIGATAFSVPSGTPSILQLQMTKAAMAKFLATDMAGMSAGALPRLLIDIETLAKDLTTIDATIRDDSPNAPWLLSMGSGSTGLPKLIPYTHSVFHARMLLLGDQITHTQSDRVASLIHFDFTTSKFTYLQTLFVGASICLFDRDNTNPIHMCRQQRITILYTAVIQVELLLDGLPSGSKNALSTLRALVPVGSTVNEDLRKRVLEGLTPNLYVRYGTNETGTITVLTPADVLSVSGTVGRPSSSVQIQVVDKNEMPLPTGGIGQVRIKSPGTVGYYQDDPAATQRAFRDGWFFPGDLGKFMPDGQFIFLGRSDQMMIMDGINIYPAEIEAVVARHPAVSDAAVIPVYSKVHQDVPVCAVALHSGASVTEQDLLDFAFQRLDSRYPRRIIIFEKLPRTEQGKLLLQQLKQMMTERLESPREPVNGH